MTMAWLILVLCCLQRLSRHTGALGFSEADRSVKRNADYASVLGRWEYLHMLNPVGCVALTNAMSL